MEIIKGVLSYYSVQIAIYAAITTLTLIFVLFTNSNKKKRYMSWKGDILNLGVFKREWVRDDDKFIQELFSENEKLTLENSTLKKDITKLTILTLLFLIFQKLGKSDKHPTNDIHQ